MYPMWLHSIDRETNMITFFYLQMSICLKSTNLFLDGEESFSCMWTLLPGVRTSSSSSISIMSAQDCGNAVSSAGNNSQVKSQILKKQGFIISNKSLTLVNSNSTFSHKCLTPNWNRLLGKIQYQVVHIWQCSKSLILYSCGRYQNEPRIKHIA